jgi:hypothetical protein
MLGARSRGYGRVVTVPAPAAESGNIPGEVVPVFPRPWSASASGVLQGECGADGLGAGVDVDAGGAQVVVAGQGHQHGRGPAVFAEVGQQGVA